MIVYYYNYIYVILIIVFIHPYQKQFFMFVYQIAETDNVYTTFLPILNHCHYYNIIVYSKCWRFFLKLLYLTIMYESNVVISLILQGDKNNVLP